VIFMEALIEEKFTIDSQPAIMTEEEFLVFCDEDIKAEYIDGEVILHSPASYKHSQIELFLSTLIKLYVDQHQLGKLWGENFQIRLRPGLRRVPDLIFVAKDTNVRVTTTEVDGNPDLVVEIVSPDSVARDYREKYFEYEQAGIKEYWIIDSINNRMEIHSLNDQGKYENQKPEKRIFKSKVLPGFWLKSDWLWQEPLPNILAIAKELNINI